MTRAELKDTILPYFITEWNAHTPVAYDNVEFTPPTNAPWVRFSIINNDTNRISIGPTTHRKYERYGYIFFQVFILGDAGTYVGDQLCEKLINIFEGKKLNSILFDTGTYTETGKDDIWYQYNGSIEWEFQEVK